MVWGAGRLRRLLSIVIAVLFAAPASSEDARRLMFSLGYDDLKQYREASPVVGVDYDFRPIGTSGRWAWRAGAAAMTDGDAWAGLGVSYTRPILKGDWFFEASFGPGVYFRKDEVPGVSNVHFPMFRTDGGIGRVLENGARVSVILSHLSDAGLREPAGSTETLFVRYGWEF